jgi:hypothetical protein
MTPPGNGRAIAPAATATSRRLWPSAVGLAIAFTFPAASVVATGPRSHPTVEGVGAAVLAAAICLYGLCCGTRRPLWARIVALGALLFASAVAGWCIFAYVSFGSGD